MIRALRLQKIGSAYYDCTNEQEFELMGVNIWPGYKPHMQLKDAGLFLQIKPEYEVIRTT
jgi:hypothetical protein